MALAVPSPDNRTPDNRKKAFDSTIRAEKFFRQGDYQQSLDALSDSLRYDSTYSRAYIWLGAVHQKLNRRSAAISAWSKVLVLSPASSDQEYASDLAYVRKNLKQLNFPQVRLNKRDVDLPLDIIVVQGQLQVVGGLKALARLLHIEYYYLPASEYVNLKSDDTEITVQIGTPFLMTGGEQTNMGAKTRRFEDDVFAPLRPVAEALGIYAKWDEKEGILHLQSKFQNPELIALPTNLPTKAGAITQRISPRQPWIAHKQRVSKVIFTPNDQILVSGSWHHDEKGNVLGDIRLWEAQSGKPLRKLAGHYATITALAFSPQGNLLSSGSFDGSVRLWDFSSGRMWILASLNSTIKLLSFSPDGTTLVCGDESGTLTLWDVQTRKVSRQFNLSSIAASPVISYGIFWPSHSLATGHKDENTCIWDVRTGSLERTLTFKKGRATQLLFSSNGQMLASLNHNTIWLWNLDSGRSIRAFTATGHPIIDFVITPDSRFIIGTDRDELVIWDLNSGQLTQKISNTLSPMSCMAIGTASKAIVTGHANGSLILWE